MKFFVIWQNDSQHPSQWMPLCPPRYLIFSLLPPMYFNPKASTNNWSWPHCPGFWTAIPVWEDTQTTWKSHRIFKSSNPECQQAHRKMGGTYGSHSHKSRNPGFSWVRELRDNQRWHFNTAQNSSSESGFTSPEPSCLMARTFCFIYNPSWPLWVSSAMFRRWIGMRGMAQGWRACAVLPDDPSSVPNTFVKQPTTIWTFSFSESHITGLLGTCTHTYTHN